MCSVSRDGGVTMGGRGFPAPTRAVPAEQVGAGKPLPPVSEHNLTPRPAMHAVSEHPQPAATPALQPVSLKTVVIALLITVVGLVLYTRSMLNGLGAGVPLALAVLGGLVALEPVLKRTLRLLARGHHRHLLLRAGRLAQLPTRGPLPAVLHGAAVLRDAGRQPGDAVGQVRSPRGSCPRTRKSSASTSRAPTGRTR